MSYDVSYKGAKVLGMTLHDRPVEVVRSVLYSLTFPGNRPDIIAVCYDRANPGLVAAMRRYSGELGFHLRETFLDDPVVGQRCPSKAWNAVFDIVPEKHGLFISSDVVLAPHSLGMAFHMAVEFPDAAIIGKCDHAGPSYISHIHLSNGISIGSRTITSSVFYTPLGFIWSLPMDTVRAIGGYDLSFMDGFCYEDTDFAVRLWIAGVDFIFCDDVCGSHIEHPRPHCTEVEKVKRNESRFVSKHGSVFKLDSGDKLGAKTWQSIEHVDTKSPGISAWLHEMDQDTIELLKSWTRMYGFGEPWVSVPVTVRETT